MNGERRQWRIENRGLWTLAIFHFLLSSFAVQSAQAAGGACPSGASYTNTSNPTGSLVTLSSLGITNCYYIAASGSDSNDGLSEASGHPWLHAPFMPNCTGNCAAVTSQSTNLWPGIGLIFRGGDTWHFGNSSASPYTGGTWEWNTGTIPTGTSSHPIYVGVDPSWYSGYSSSWARPIFTADNPLCNASTAGTLSDGATCTATTDWYGQPSYYVSSCAYQIGSTNDFIEASWVYGYIWDNFEMTGLCQSSLGQPGHHDDYLSYGSIQGPTTFQNLYIHGASHLQFQATNGSNCTGIVCINISAFTGGSTIPGTGETVVNNVVDFTDSDPGGQGLCFGGFYNVAYNVFRYTTGCEPSTLHVFHDNLYEYFFENGHANMIESYDPPGTNATYNNVFRHVETYFTTPLSGGGVALWFGPAQGATDYIFNNVMYDVGLLEYLNIGWIALATVYGNYVWVNNTWQSNYPQPILRCGSYTNGTVTDTNNHYIDDQNYLGGPCSTLTTTTPLQMTNATAMNDGYTSSEMYAYSPIASNSPTVGAGTNEQPFCNAFSAAAQSDPTLSDAATACLSDTRYACTYNSTNHTVTCPARTPVVRPTTWDAGAYQICPPGQQCTSSPPPPPTTTSSYSPRVYPNPWRSDKHSGQPVTFANLPLGSTVKLYTVSGHKVKELSTQNSGLSTWDLTNDSGDKVASGIYVYLITDTQGDKVRGKVAVIK